MESFSHNQLQIHVQRKAFYRSLRLSVAPSGKIMVTAGKGASQRALQQFVDKESAWLQKHLNHIEKTKKQFPLKKFEEGESFPYMGREFSLKIVDSPNLFITFMGSQLVFHRPPGLTRQKCLLRLKRTYKETAKKILTRRVHLYTQKMQLFPTGLSFREQKSIWGSCSGENRISLNWKLVVAPLWVIDYVVIHELAHIVHKDHSSKFWQLVETQTPNRQEARRWLKEQVFLGDFLSKKSELWPEEPGKQSLKK